jgi:hypothetical protein
MTVVNSNQSWARFPSISGRFSQRNSRNSEMLKSSLACTGAGEDRGPAQFNYAYIPDYAADLSASELQDKGEDEG